MENRKKGNMSDDEEDFIMGRNSEDEEFSKNKW